MVRSLVVTGTMPAAVYQGHRTVTVERLPIPEAGDGEVLLEVSHCGICGSDLHLMMEDWGQPGSTGGHEYSGVIVSVGDNVSGWGVGDRVIGGPERGCGRCAPCSDGRANLCLGKDRAGVTPFQGAFAAYKKLRAESLYRIPPGLDLRTAALTEPTAVALRGVHRSGLEPGRRALITGAGPIGLLSVAVLRAFGIDDITVTEPAPTRRARASAVGASRVLEPSDLPTVPRHPAALVDEPYHAAIECSGRPDAMEAALGQLTRAGVLVLSGTGIKRPRFDSNRIILNELVITGTVEYTDSDYLEAVELLTAGRLPVAALIEPEDVPLSGVQAAMERLVAGELPGKVLVAPHA